MSRGGSSNKSRGKIRIMSRGAAAAVVVEGGAVGGRGRRGAVGA